MRAKLPWILPWVFALPILVFIHRFGVNFPVWDQWDIAKIFTVEDRGLARLLRFAERHNQSRLFFPKLIWLYLGRLSGWDTRLELYCSWLLAVATAFVLIPLIRASFPGRRNVVICCTAFACAMLFDAAQWGNFLRGDQLCVFLTVFCVAVALRVSSSALPIPRILLYGGAVATVASLSFGNGILCVLIPPGILFLSGRRGLAKNGLSLGLYSVWAGLLGVLATRAVIDYSISRDPVRAQGSALVNAMESFLTLLGNPFVFADVGGLATIGLGLVLVLAFGFATWISVRGRRPRLRETEARVLAPWIALAVFGLLSSAATSGLRGAPGGGTDTRHATNAVLFSLGLSLWLWCLAPRKLERSLLILTLLVVSVNYSRGLAWAWPRGNSQKQAFLASKAAIHFLSVSSGADLRTRFFIRERGEYLERTALALSRLGYLKPRLASSDEIDTHGAEASLPCRGSLDLVRRVGQERVQSWGWAPDETNQSPADAVLISATAPGKSAKIVAIAELDQDRPDLVKGLGVPGLRRAGWNSTFEMKSWPAGTVVRAWSYDTTTMRISPVCGEVRAP
jgi:hypothetical protein